MSSLSKVTIVQYLRDKNDSRFWKNIEDSWAKFNFEDKFQVFQFLFNCGHWRFFCDVFIYELSNSEDELPWAFLLTIFSHHKVAIPDNQKNHIQRYLKKIKVKIDQVESYEQLIVALRLKAKYKQLAEIQHRKQELLASAKIAQSEQLYEKQLSYLEELNRLFPKDNHVRQDLHSRRISDAEKILSRSKRYQNQISSEKLKEEKEESPIIENLKGQAREWVSKHPEAKMDVALMFRQMGHSRAALEFIESDTMTEREAWLVFDFLFQADQFLAVLHHCEAMKIQFAGEPAALFSISYMEALAYWELGEKHRAIELMSHIAHMKPNFRSANELLYSWQEESN